MAEPAQQTPDLTCSELMNDDKPCGRPVVAVEGVGVNRGPVCLMHSVDPNKDGARFDHEIRAILDGTSQFNHAKDFHDFNRFVFLTAKFDEVVFHHNANFFGALFIEKADFSGAVFKKAVVFAYASFNKGAQFNGARFTEEASFVRAQFGPRNEAEGARITERHADPFLNPSATFYAACFLKPNESSFFQVNNRRREGWHAGLANCEEVDRLDFTDVHWFKLNRRIVLQDELAVRCGYLRQPEIVAKAYRQLVSNFERARSYDLAEDCFIGAMEMKRLDPRNHILGPVGRWLSTTNLYRLLSKYGSSYVRAFSCLIAFLFLFALLFPAFGLQRTEVFVPGSVQQAKFSAKDSAITWAAARVRPHRLRKLWGTFEDGFWASVETATFQKNATLRPLGPRGQHLAIFEDVVIPGQLALFLLALRRRFRR